VHRRGSCWPKQVCWTASREPTHLAPRARIAGSVSKSEGGEDRIFITDGPVVWTSAGMTAGIDLALAMIEQDLGAVVARTVARQTLVVYHRRAAASRSSLPCWSWSP